MKTANKWKFGLLATTVLLGTALSACTSETQTQPKTNDTPKTEPANAKSREIRTLQILTRPQASSPDEYERANLIAGAMKELGITAELKPMPYEQQSDIVWYKRDEWDMTGWQMAARPERLDPDEFVYNLFHSSTAKDGYNFVGYNNPEYDKIAEQQRITVDREERKNLIFKAQELIASDVAYLFNVHPKLKYVYNHQVFDKNSIVEMAGMGIRNIWTYLNATPIGQQKNMVLNSNDSVQAINPFYISGSFDSWVTELIWDRLMRIDKDGLPKPWAAESVAWKTDTQVEIKLRADMKWHDGKPVTAEDVKFSYEAPLTGEVPMYKPFVEIIDKIDIKDPLTLEFTLKRPWAAFETASLSKLNLVPKHIWGPIIEDLKNKPENAESYQEKTPIGSGPFKYENWKFKEEVVLSANNEHFSPAKIEKWIMKEIPNTEASLGMIENGEINFLAVFPGDGQLLQQKVEASQNLTMITTTDLGFQFFAVNHRRPPFNDVAFRRALAAAIDRDMMAQVVYKDFAEPGDSVISPALSIWKNPNLPYPTGGVEEAKKLLQEAGYEWDAAGKLLYPAGKKEELGK
ncbi:ABC transporter substrate-binding protein [Brevibacillus sp. NRS-1366]|uniref:ABC transporter substrate-binding protein n=1 Tax=Brevibacillus sp. NRS-1366 TaxID=3233899 RepID=UPI003D1DD781